MHLASHPPSVRSPGAHQMLAGLVFQRHGGLTEPLNTKKSIRFLGNKCTYTENLSFPSEQMWPGVHFVPVGLDLPPKSHPSSQPVSQSVSQLVSQSADDADDESVEKHLAF